MLIQVQSVSPTRSGKGYMVNGKYFAKLNIGIEQNLGKQIEAVLGSFVVNNTTIETIEGFTVSTSQPATAYTPQTTQERPQAIDRWWLPFVSNQCAHAIQAGLIVSGDDLIKWAGFSKAAVLLADSSKMSEFKTSDTVLDIDVPVNPDGTIPF